MLTLCLITPGGLAILWRLLVPTGDQPGRGARHGYCDEGRVGD